MTDLILTTFDWVPDMPRGFVRDLRVRWALEEAGLAYRVEGVPLGDWDASLLAHQPFKQVPWLTDGDLSIFESGAILLHLGARREVLLSSDPMQKSAAVQWLFAALNSVEVAVMPWMILCFSGDDFSSPGGKSLLKFRDGRLQRMEQVLEAREWLAGEFSVADILMADVLRICDRENVLAGYPACHAYVRARRHALPFKRLTPISWRISRRQTRWE